MLMFSLRLTNSIGSRISKREQQLMLGCFRDGGGDCGLGMFCKGIVDILIKRMLRLEMKFIGQRILF